MTIGMDPVVRIVGGSGPHNWGGEDDQHSGDEDGWDLSWISLGEGESVSFSGWRL